MRLGDIVCKISEDLIDIGEEEIEIYDLDVRNLDLSHLKPKVQELVRKTIDQNKQAFAENSDVIGSIPTELYQAEIKLQPGKYSFINNYRKNPKESKVLSQLEHRLLRAGVLEKCDQLPRNRSVNMVVKKPNSGPRLTLKSAR